MRSKNYSFLLRAHAQKETNWIIKKTFGNEKRMNIDNKYLYVCYLSEMRYRYRNEDIKYIDIFIIFRFSYARIK